jgi:hypothetical protein
MPQQPTFKTPLEAMQFIQDSLARNDAANLYAAFTQPPSDLWRETLFQDLREIQNTETLRHVFLEHARLTAFPEQGTSLHLGGHDPRTHHLHITLTKTPFGWVFESIVKCR